MNLYLRLLFAWLRSKRLGRISPVTPLNAGFRVLPHDLDAFGHMNNGRYLQIMDVARFEWMLRSGMLDAMVDGKWSPLLGGTLTRYRHALNALQRYRVETRLIYWDGCWVYIEHRFLDSSDRCVATGCGRAAMRKGGFWVSPQETLDSLLPGCVQPPPPDYIRSWLEAEKAMFSSQRPTLSIAGGTSIPVGDSPDAETPVESDAVESR